MLRWIKIALIILVAIVNPACAQRAERTTEHKPESSAPGRQPLTESNDIAVSASEFFTKSFGATLDEQLNALAARLQLGDDPAVKEFPATIRSIAGKIAIGREVADLAPRLRSAALHRALSETDTEKMVVSHQSSNENDVQTLQNRSKDVARQLNGNALETQLKDLLQRPDGPTALAAISEDTDVASNPLPPDIAPYFERNRAGKYVINSLQRSAAQEHLQQIKPLVDAVDDAVKRLHTLADKMDANSAFAQRYQAALREPLFAAAIGLKMSQSGPPPQGLAQAVEQEAKKALRPKNGGRFEMGDVDRRQIEQLLDTIDKARNASAGPKSELTAAASQIGSGDALEAGFKDVLTSPVALIAATAKTLESPGNNARGDLTGTAVADVLLKKGQTYDIVRWRRGEAESIVNRLRQTLDDADLLRSTIEKASVAAGASKRQQTPLEQLQLVSKVSKKVDEDFSLRFGVWVDANFSRDGNKVLVRPEAKEKIVSLIRDSKQIEKQLSKEPTIAADLSAAKFDKTPLPLFKSSAFYNPRTAESRKIYLEEFPDHHAARLWGVFEWDAYESKDFASFIAKLQARKSEIAELAAKHDKLMVVLSFTPSWISSSSNDKTVEGHWHYRNAVRAKDWTTWERMVTEAVQFLAQFRTVQWYFEVWNEPDLAYWQEGAPEYLEMYEHTVNAVKRGSPNAKVGGATVNGWQGKPAAAKGGQSLNLELIQFAKNAICLWIFYLGTRSVHQPTMFAKPLIVFEKLSDPTDIHRRRN